MSASTAPSLHEKSPLLESNKRPGRWNWKKSSKEERYVLVIHGGAGTMSKDRSTPELRVKYKAALSAALRAGHAVLKDGAEAMDAAVAAVSSMEGNNVWMHSKMSLIAVCSQTILCSIPERALSSIQEGR